jgi:hypothetical protein
MADPQNSAAAVTPAQPAVPAQPATPVDDGFERISRDELTTLRRNSERLRGSEKLFQAASQHGFKRAEDFDKYGKFASTLKSRNLTLEQMTAAFETPETDTGTPAAGGGGFDAAALDKYLAEKKYLTEDQVSQREAKQSATFEHKQAMAKESDFIKKGIESLIGEGASNRDKYLIQNAVKAILDEKRGFYPEGHPLAEVDRAPFDETTFGAVLGEIKKQITLQEGEDLAKQGDAAAKGVSTPAGATTTRPIKPASKGDESAARVIGSPESRRAIQEQYDKRVQGRKQGPVSTARG